jgi:hypothetical protein
MSTTHRTSVREGRPRRGAVLVAGIAALVCGSAMLSITMTEPVGAASRIGAPGRVSDAPPAVASGAAAMPSTPSTQRSPGVPSNAHPATPEKLPTLIPASLAPAALGTSSLEADLVLLGSWTVEYVVGPKNGGGANIEIPLRHLDHLVIRPGTTFDFWKAVGEVSRRTGYRNGAIIVGNHIDPDGALAGGICTVSTALFNAAARAGLEIVSRRSHGGYIARYPLGLDAAVAEGPGFSQTMAFRNDTAEPIVVRTVSTPGIARVDLYAKIALGREVTFSQPAIRHRAKAPDRHVTTRSLPRGETKRVEPPSDGMTVSVTRTVRDANGALLHRERWVSTYRPLDGLLLVGTR